MGLFERVKRQLRSVIEWQDPSPNSLFHRWSNNGDEIKDASKLIVGPGQGCIFIYEGRVEALIIDEGITDLETDNVPFWTTVSKIMQGFTSEHKVGIYYFKMTTILNQRWGTPSVIKYEDPKYKFPVGLRAYGNYSFRIADPAAFFVNVIGGRNDYTTDEFRQVMGARIVQPLTDYLAEGGYTYADIDAQREEIAAGLLEKIKPEFDELGFSMEDFRIEGTSFDEDTMRRINRIADMSAESQAAAAAGLNFAQMQQLEAMRDAARNEGGAGMGMGMGAGMAFGNMMGNTMQGGAASPGGTTAQPGAGNGGREDPMVKLGKLKKMLDAGFISQEEYDAKKKQILDSF